MATTTQRQSRQQAAAGEQPSHLSLAYWLSGLLAAVTVAASAAAFFITGLFQRDNPALAGCGRGTALVILAVAVPLLLISMRLAARGSQRARLVWLGMLTYIFYNSFYFTFSASFNRLTLAFIAMLSLSGWGLLALLLQIRPEEVKAAFSAKTPVRFTAIVLLLPVLIFLLVDLREGLVSTLTNSIPPSVLNTQMPTNHFHVVDLAFLVPLFLIAAAWLWQRRAWGYTLAGMMLSYYTIELFGIGVDQYYGGIADPTSTLADAAAMPVFLGMAAVSLVILVIYLRKHTK